jgi:hypothetical protein
MPTKLLPFNKTNDPVKFNLLKEYMRFIRDFHGIEAMTDEPPMFYKKHFDWGVDFSANTFGKAVGKLKKELTKEGARERKPIIDLTSEDEDEEIDDSDNELIPANEAQEEDTSGSPEVSVDDLLSAPSNDSLLVSDQQHDETTNRIDAFGGEDLPVAAREGKNLVAAGPESSILQVVSVSVCRCLIRVFSMLLFFFLTALKISIDSFALTDDEKEVALKRTCDRRSGTGRGKEIEKGGGGGRNWGSDKIEARTNEGPVDESAPVGETTTTESEAVVEESVAVDVEEITMPKEKTD